MTSTPVTIRLNNDLPTVTQAGADLAGLKPSILKHAEAIYAGEAENAKGKNNKFNENVLGQRTDSKGNVRHSGAIYDAFNVFGARPKVIQGLLNDTNRLRAFQQGPNELGRYNSLNWVDRHIHKITDEDITKALHAREITRRENSDDFQSDLEDLTPSQRASVTSLTPVREVRNMAKDEREYTALEKEVRGMELGGYSLDQLVARNNGQRISKQELEQLKTDLEPLQTEAIRATQSHDSNLQTQDVSRTVSLGNLDLSRTQEANNNAIRRAEIDYNNAKLQQDTDIANLKLKYEYDSANFDRELKRDLALLGLDSQREERQYRSERDQAQDRQMFILQLMKGLGGLGQSLSGY